MSKSRLWTGSKRVNDRQFVDENGIIVDPFCNLKMDDVENKSGNLYGNLTFPSEMSAEINGTHVYWRNAIPSKGLYEMLKLSNRAETTRPMLMLQGNYAYWRAYSCCSWTFLSPCYCSKVLYILKNSIPTVWYLNADPSQYSLYRLGRWLL